MAARDWPEENPGGVPPEISTVRNRLKRRMYSGPRVLVVWPRVLRGAMEPEALRTKKRSMSSGLRRKRGSAWSMTR